MLFGRPQPEAAQILGISLTTLKQVCRRLGVTRWPYRRPSKACRPSKPQPDPETPGVMNPGLTNPASSLPSPFPANFQRPGMFRDSVRDGKQSATVDSAGEKQGAHLMRLTGPAELNCAGAAMAGLNVGAGPPYWQEHGAAAERTNLVHAIGQADRRDADFQTDGPASGLMPGHLCSLHALSRGQTWHAHDAHSGSGIHRQWLGPPSGFRGAPAGPGYSWCHQDSHTHFGRLDARSGALGHHGNSVMGMGGLAHRQDMGGWAMNQSLVRAHDEGNARSFQAGPFLRSIDAENREYFELPFQEQSMGPGAAAGVSARSHLATGDAGDLRLIGGIGGDLHDGHGNAFLRSQHRGQPNSTAMAMGAHAAGERVSFGGDIGNSHRMWRDVPGPREVGNSIVHRQNRPDIAFGGASSGMGNFDLGM